MSLLAYRDYLAHHGIKGQKWGIRRFQNEDGSLTPEGRERYSKELYKRLKEIDNQYARDIRNPSNFVIGAMKRQQKIDDIVEDLKKNSKLKSIEKPSDVKKYIDSILSSKYGKQKLRGAGVDVETFLTNSLLFEANKNMKTKEMEKYGFKYDDDGWHEKQLKNGNTLTLITEAGEIPSKTLINAARDYEKNQKQHDKVVLDALRKELSDKRYYNLDNKQLENVMSNLKPAGVRIHGNWSDNDIAGEISYYDPTYTNHWFDAEYDFTKKKVGHISMNG